MGSVIQDRKAWQDVVVEKRRHQAELLARFATGDGTRDTDEAFKFESQKMKQIQGSELVAQLAGGEISCETLIKKHIEKLVE